MSPMAEPSDTSAETSGSAMAKSDPNTRNSTMPAAMIPMPTPPI
jgi:hypothetical protein